MESISQKVRKLLGRDLHDFMKAKGITENCPSCRSDQVGIMSSGPDEPLQLYKMELLHPEVTGGGTVEVAGMVCGNCGYIRTFAADSIVLWKEQGSPDA